MVPKVVHCWLSQTFSLSRSHLSAARPLETEKVAVTTGASVGNRCVPEAESEVKFSVHIPTCTYLTPQPKDWTLSQLPFL